MYQSGRTGDEAKKRKSPTKSGKVGISEIVKYIPQGHGIWNVPGLEKNQRALMSQLIHALSYEMI